MGLNSLRPSTKKKESSKSNKRKLEKKLSFYASGVTTMLILFEKNSSINMLFDLLQSISGLIKLIQPFEEVKDTVASLSVKKTISKKQRRRSRQKKLKAYDLSTLSEFLPEAPGTSQRRTLHDKLKLNSKSRLKLVEKEGNQLKAVLNHPIFQADPLAAIHKHLENTQPLPESNEVKRPRKPEEKKPKRKRSKVSTGVQSMEV